MKLNENQKVTLTIGQLKRLVMEASKVKPEFEIDEDGYLYKYNGSSGDIVVPDGVTSIGPEVFNKYRIKSVMLPDTVEEIEHHAFYGCGISTIKLPDSVKWIDESAFSYCRKLVSITIPSSVTFLHPDAFDGCENLNEIRIANPKLLKKVLTNRDYSSMRQYNPTSCD